LDYAFHIIILVCVYGTLAISLDLLAGHSGQLSLAHAAFYGIGAYVSALLALRFGSPVWLAALVALGVAAMTSSVIALTAMRLFDDYFIIATFCFQMMFLNIADSWISLTRGPLGLSGIPQLGIFGWTTSTRAENLMLALGMLAFAWLFARRLISSPFGRVLHAIREDDILVRALGKNDFYFKAVVFAVSSCLAAGAGVFYAAYVSYIDPSSFTVTESILVLAMVIVGGAGRLVGPVVGAAALVLLPELLRALGFPVTVAAEIRQIIYGILLAAIVLVRPDQLLRETNSQTPGNGR
jgi:ABC-type branched-subunit amino acid transport system permease subunit